MAPPRTANSLITQALKVSGVLGQGQIASAEDMNDALQHMNQMLAQWRTQRWLVYRLADVSKVSTGAQSYTVGPGGDFNVARPEQIASGFFRQLNPTAGTSGLVDFNMSIIRSRQDYNSIALKQMPSFPQAVFYDNTYPLGTLLLWPVPNTNFEIHISVLQDLEQIDSLIQVINLPMQYDAALMWNLAARLRPSYQLPPDQTVTAMAKVALNVIRNATDQVPLAQIDPALTGIGGARYDMYSDTFHV